MSRTLDTDFKQWGIADETRFIRALGTPALGRPLMSRLAYLQAYAKAIKARTRFDTVTREQSLGLVAKAIAEIPDGHEAMPEQRRVREGIVPVYHNRESHE